MKIAVSLIAIVCMFILTLNEIVLWRTIRVEDHLLVDSSQGERDIDISIDMTFHVLSCNGS